MKKSSGFFDKFMWIIGIASAGIGLIQAIFDTDKTTELEEKVEGMQKRIDDLEKR